MTLRVRAIAERLDGAAPLDFRSFGAFSGGSAGVFRSNPGTSPWELHPDGEELLHVLEGVVDIEVLPQAGPSEIATVSAGCVLIVPRNAWHRHVVREPLVEIYVTTGCTEMSHAADPRVADG